MRRRQCPGYRNLSAAYDGIKAAYRNKPETVKLPLWNKKRFAIVKPVARHSSASDSLPGF
jgi:hypothetical protein